MQSRNKKLNKGLGQSVNLNLSLNIAPNTPVYEKKQLFGCRHCSRVFFSPQALGGHMNAHRTDTKKAAKRCVCQQKQPRKTAAVLLSGLSGPSMRSLGHADPSASSPPNPDKENAEVDEPMYDESKTRVPYMPDESGVDFAHNSDDQIDLNLRL